MERALALFICGVALAGGAVAWSKVGKPLFVFLGWG
jgi:hypothetical protein